MAAGSVLPVVLTGPAAPNAVVPYSVVSRSISASATKIAFWRVIRLEVSRSATTQPLPMDTTSADRIRAAVITSIRLKPRWPLRRSLQRIALADAFQPVEDDGVCAGGAVAPVGRRRIAIDHGAAFAACLARGGRLNPAGGRGLGRGHGAGRALWPADRGGTGGAQNGPYLELHGRIARLGGGNEGRTGGAGAERGVAADHHKAEIAGAVQIHIQTRCERGFAQGAAGAAVKAVAHLVAALFGGDVQKIGLGLGQMRLLNIGAVDRHRDSRQHADDRYHDHQFDQGKAALAAQPAERGAHGRDGSRAPLPSD